jgi:hypothetical protein
LHPYPSVPDSEVQIRHQLVGRWYQLDVTGEFRLPHRFELTFAGDGTCTYYYIPRDPAHPAGITDGTWRLDGRSLAFQWTPRNSLAATRPIHDGPIRHLDRHRLDINDPLFKGVTSFYRTYSDSQITPVDHP